MTEVYYRVAEQPGSSRRGQQPRPRPGVRFGYATRFTFPVNCGGIMGDPFQELTLKNGYFTVEHYGGSAQRWTRFVTFRYDPASRTWLLHRDGSEHFHALDPEHGFITMRPTKNFGRVFFTQFDIYCQP